MLFLGSRFPLLMVLLRAVLATDSSNIDEFRVFESEAKAMGAKEVKVVWPGSAPGLLESWAFSANHDHWPLSILFLTAGSSDRACFILFNEVAIRPETYYIGFFVDSYDARKKDPVAGSDTYTLKCGLNRYKSRVLMHPKYERLWNYMVEVMRLHNHIYPSIDQDWRANCPPGYRASIQAFGKAVCYDENENKVPIGCEVPFRECKRNADCDERSEYCQHCVEEFSRCQEQGEVVPYWIENAVHGDPASASSSILERLQQRLSGRGAHEGSPSSKN